MKYSVDMRSLNKLVRNFHKRSDEALEKCGEHLKTEIKKQLYYDSYDLGTLIRSVECRLVKHGLVEVGSALVYAPIREYGRQPGKFPPLQSLVGWTSRKHIIKGGAMSRYEDLHYTDKGKIYVIARAIATKGTKGKHTFQKVLDREREQIKKLYIQNMQ